MQGNGYSLCYRAKYNFLTVDKARLGRLVHKKSAAVVCLTDFKDHQTELANITRVCRDTFNNVTQTFKKPEKGLKSLKLLFFSRAS